MPIIYEPIPATLDEAIDRLFGNLSPEEHSMIASTDKCAIRLHTSVGMGLRNEWGLWSGSPLKTHFEETFGLHHADDMSSMILDGLECRVKGLPFNPKGKAKESFDYWAAPENQ